MRSSSGWSQLHPNCVQKTEHERLIAVRCKDAFVAGELVGEKSVLERVRKAIDKVGK